MVANASVWALDLISPHSHIFGQALLNDPGATIIPIILGSDKTTLTDFGGDKEAWPLYLSIGNILTQFRNKASMNAFILIAYIPVAKFNYHDDYNGVLRDRIFHQAVKFVLHSIAVHGYTPLEICDSKGDVRSCYTLIAAHIGDHLEKLLISCTAHSHSPLTLHRKDEFGSDQRAEPRTREYVLTELEKLHLSKHPIHDFKAFVKASKAIGLNGVHDPFWKYHRFADPSVFLAPDLLHAVFKFFRDHVRKWVQAAVGRDVLDSRLKVLPSMIGFRHFGKGIQHISQWTGREDRELLRSIVAASIGGLNDQCMKSLRAMADVVYLAQYQSHSETTLQYLSEALQTFHDTKHAWIECKARTSKKGVTKVLLEWQIPKLSGLLDLVPSVRELGSLIGYTADVTEKKHIVAVKLLYEATNKKDYMNQMCRGLDRDEKIDLTNLLLDLRFPVVEELDPFDSNSPRGSLGLSDACLKAAMDEGRILPMTKFAGSGLNALSLLLGPTIRLNRPIRTGVSITHLAEQYLLPDLVPALHDYLSGYSKKYHRKRSPEATDSSRPIPDKYQLVNVWEKFRLFNTAIQDDDFLLPHRTVLAMPPSAERPYGDCYPVLVNDNDDAGYTGLTGTSHPHAQTEF